MTHVVRHIITLSTIPPRFGSLGPVLKSLIGQTSRPEAVELYIPHSYRRFPQWGGGLPEVPQGVRIVRVAEDFGPATKVLAAARAWRGQEIELIHVDDDRVLDRNWARLALGLRKQHAKAVICGAGFRIADRYGYSFSGTLQPKAVHAIDPRAQFGHQIRKITHAIFGPITGKRGLSPPWRRFDQSGYVDIAEGYGGVLVRPDYIDDAAFQIPPVIWTVDDIWLSGNYARLGVPIWAEKTLNRVEEVIEISRNLPLFKAVIDGADRDAADRACIDFMRETMGIWGGPGG